MPVLLDTSTWTKTLRRKGGDPIVRSRVRRLIDEQSAAWCDPVRLELWAGVRGDAERKELLQLDREVIRLPITDAIWTLACQIASSARERAFTFPANDLLIYACAYTHGVRIDCADEHDAQLESLMPYS